MAHILALLHLPTSNPGLVGAQLEAAGHTLTLCRPLHGDSLPSLDEADATVVFGGPQHLYAPCSGLVREINWIEGALKRNHPLLGICLGAQMVANALGARVFTDPKGRVEVGYTPVDSAPSQPWLTETRTVYQWHHDGFDLPDQAQLVARGRDDAFPTQAFSHGRSLAFQFHLEITTPIMEHWLARDHGDLMRPGASTAVAHREAHAQHAQHNASWLNTLLTRWVSPSL